MSDRQLIKYRVNDSLYRIRWYGYGHGVRSVLELFDGTEWNEIERSEEGKGTPSQTEEKLIIDQMTKKIETIYEPDTDSNDFYILEQREWRSR